MRKLLIILFGIVSTVSVAILLILLYRYATKDGGASYHSLPAESVVPLKKRGKDEAKASRPWLEKLAIKRRPTYSYAVSEMEIVLPLKKKPPHENIHRLILKDLDDYKIFCIKQLLERMHIRYAFYRKKREGVLAIRDSDKKTIQKIVSVAKAYDVQILLH
ncbi:hypothetical protein [Hydrogenimonas sp.]